jgi:hypothetical protein
MKSLNYKNSEPLIHGINIYNPFIKPRKTGDYLHIIDFCVFHCPSLFSRDVLLRIFLCSGVWSQLDKHTSHTQ